MLREHYASAPLTSLEAMLPGRGRRTIQCKANGLGLARLRAAPMTPDQVREAKRNGVARKRAADPDAARARERAMHHANREARTATMRAYYAKRFFWGRAMKLRGPGKASARDLAALWKAQRGRCALTGRRLDRTAQLDHKTAKARAGQDHIENLQWLCEEANLAKRALSDEKFIALCGDVMRWIGERIVQADAIPLTQIERSAA